MPELEALTSAPAPAAKEAPKEKKEEKPAKDAKVEKPKAPEPPKEEEEEVGMGDLFGWFSTYLNSNYLYIMMLMLFIENGNCY